MEKYQKNHITSRAHLNFSPSMFLASISYLKTYIINQINTHQGPSLYTQGTRQDSEGEMTNQMDQFPGSCGTKL